jgi:hypothetical protein
VRAPAKLDPGTYTLRGQFDVGPLGGKLEATEEQTVAAE